MASARSIQALRCLTEASALHTLIRQRLPTPSCGGHSPYREENSEPGRYVTESNRRKRRNATGAKDPSLLAGMLFNGAGERFTPSHAVKRGRRNPTTAVLEKISRALGVSTTRLLDEYREYIRRIRETMQSQHHKLAQSSFDTISLTNFSHRSL